MTVHSSTFNIAYISIGSNIGDRLGFCQRAVTTLRDDTEMQLTKLSSLYETDPVDYLEQDHFYNAVIALETILSADALLSKCQKIELSLAKNIQISKGPRTIDLDLLFYNDHISSSARLTLPHPEIARRLFVLIPFAEIAPQHIHPEEGCTIETLLNRFSSVQFKAVKKRFETGWDLV